MLLPHKHADPSVTLVANVARLILLLQHESPQALPVLERLLAAENPRITPRDFLLALTFIYGVGLIEYDPGDDILYLTERTGN